MIFTFASCNRFKVSTLIGPKFNGLFLKIGVRIIKICRYKTKYKPLYRVI